MVDIGSSLCGVALPTLFYNASGVYCRFKEELDALVRSDAGALVTKSATLSSREGNPEPRYAPLGPLGSINSMGLPNEGFEYYANYAEKHDFTKKPLFISIAGLSLDENISMAEAYCERFSKNSRCILEVNFSCPNVPGKPQLGYDMEATEKALKRLAPVVKRPFGVKLPPYFDIAHFDSLAGIVNRVDGVGFLTCINSIGNGLAIDFNTEAVLIKPKDGFGGLGGQLVLNTALANVNAFHRRLIPSKQVVGCGGVVSAKEVFLHVLAGASAVQVGTQLKEEGPKIFSRLSRELKEIMQTKGYSTVEDFKGKVKTL